MVPALVKKRLQFVIVSCLFLTLSLWWLKDYFAGTPLHFGLLNFANSYFIVALFGGLFGLASSYKWGFLKSHLGSSMTYFSLGLLAQVFGQLSYSYLTYIKGIEVPYPSIGDVGYFGSIPLYILGALSLMKVFALKTYSISFSKKTFSVLIPILLLTICYVVFLSNRTFSLENLVKSLLDFGYPFFQAVYLSLALVSYFLSRGVLGGIMRKKVLFLLFALVIQFVADFTFLYRADRGLIYPGGFTDYLYLVAYFFMSIAIIDFGLVFDQIKNGKTS